MLRFCSHLRPGPRRPAPALLRHPPLRAPPKKGHTAGGSATTHSPTPGLLPARRRGFFPPGDFTPPWINKWKRRHDTPPPSSSPSSSHFIPKSEHGCRRRARGGGSGGPQGGGMGGRVEAIGALLLREKKPVADASACPAVPRRAGLPGPPPSPPRPGSSWAGAAWSCFPLRWLSSLFPAPPLAFYFISCGGVCCFLTDVRAERRSPPRPAPPRPPGRPPPPSCPGPPPLPAPSWWAVFKEPFPRHSTRPGGSATHPCQPRVCRMYGRGGSGAGCATRVRGACVGWCHLLPPPPPPPIPFCPPPLCWKSRGRVGSAPRGPWKGPRRGRSGLPGSAELPRAAEALLNRGLRAARSFTHFKPPLRALF